MSDKISGFTVVFDKSVSEEYMEMIRQAISLYKGVSSVETFVEDAGTYLGQMQARTRITKALYEFISSDFKQKEKAE